MSYIIILNPLPNKNIPHLIDVCSNAPSEFIVSSMKEKSILKALTGPSYTVHVMHPNLVIDGTVLINRVGGNESFGNGKITVNSITDYLTNVIRCPEEVIDNSGNPCIKWSCEQLGIKYTGIDKWDIEFNDPILFINTSQYYKALLPNYEELWNIIGNDITQYILIMCIINDMEYWTKGLKNREIYLKSSPFETKVYLFMDGLAPKAFKDKFNYWINASKDIIPDDYVLDAQSIMSNAYKLCINKVQDEDVNEYDSIVIKNDKMYYSNPFNYL